VQEVHVKAKSSRLQSSEPLSNVTIEPRRQRAKQDAQMILIDHGMQIDFR
jgi:hypothetical protein